MVESRSELFLAPFFKLQPHYRQIRALMKGFFLYVLWYLWKAIQYNRLNISLTGLFHNLMDRWRTAVNRWQVLF